VTDARPRLNTNETEFPMKTSNWLKTGILAALVTCALGVPATQAQPPGNPPKPVKLAPQITLGIHADFTRNGVVIRGVEPDSAAERLGLERGDVIWSINGKVVNSNSSYVQAMNDCGGSVEMMVRNVRDGRYVIVRGSLTPPPPAGLVYGPPGRP
jgi:S1-C subfamily serine protease